MLSEIPFFLLVQIVKSQATASLARAGIRREHTEPRVVTEGMERQGPVSLCKCVDESPRGPLGNDSRLVY